MGGFFERGGFSNCVVGGYSNWQNRLEKLPQGLINTGGSFSNGVVFPTATPVESWLVIKDSLSVFQLACPK